MPLDEQARTALIAMADGDGRYLLNLCEALFALPPDSQPLDTAALAEVCRSARRSTTRPRTPTTI